MTVWLFTEGGGVEVRAIVHRSIQWQGGGLCGSRKYPYSPHRRDWKFRGGWGVSRSKKFKAMYELEFPEGWGGGVIGQIPSVGGGGYGYFL